ncbi:MULTISPECIES: bifunctional GNAT family N-acetyltransferase/acetate--CoA ligase family protein [unclassified Streptomyces]|uniref:bifunctional acetate--CoA ligase family protein/GNAT family N-acetyltransferase n=1 Tax=unclassified Streptomyces TaxID=2593676 RepID=UPI000BF546EA|nr:bifunctional GNAT family N-acetyltransferase/acetate--CoA ligase family protein [Streptomyces sp. Ru87]PGH47194.1 GNAT family N-acetyltransferase [Streptomyces sp. Ru87]
MTQTARRAPDAPGAHALLSDGRTVQIRPARPDDRDGLLAFYEGMSAESLRLRFLGASRLSGRQSADRLCASPRRGRLALVVSFAGRVVGVAEYETGEDPATAEIALAVADDFRHQGAGTLLLEHLMHAAREAGVTAFTADTLADNHPVLKVFTDLGLEVTRRFDHGDVHCVIRLAPGERYRSAVDERARTADSASLRPLLRPRSIAVIGAGSRPGSVGRAVLKNLRRAGFPGRLHAVNPHARHIEHTPCHATVAELPHPPDLAVLTVPAAAVPETADQCGRAGVRALVVLTSGLDAGQGAALHAACRRHGMRLAGPNSLGLANTEEEVRLDATFAAHRPLPGTAGVAVQSGGVGIALLGGLSRLGIGVSSFVSLGDKYDVSGNDLLQWWEGDGRTELALLHLESFGNARAFSRTARRVARRMPVLTVDAGRSDAGRRAAASHTAAAATPTMTRQALFRQAGVTATRSVGELLDTAALLHSQPLPAGTKVAVVSNAGGAAVLAADACTEAGLTVPELPAGLVTDLLGLLPGGASAANPVDATAAVGDRELRACVDRLAGHGAVDAVLVVLVPTALAEATGDDPIRVLTHAGSGNRPRTVAAVLLDQAERVRLLHTPGGGAVPAYADPEPAARALAHAAARARWLDRPAGTVPKPPGTDPAGAREITEAFLAEHPEGGWLDPRRCAGLLDCYGVQQLPWAWAETEQEAVEAAARLAAAGSGRVVLKAHWPRLLHKSDHGAVLLDLDGEEQVRAAHRDLRARLGDVMTGVLVQPMAGRGTELVAGVVQDEVFGPLVLFGLGGTATELLADHVACFAPLTDQDVHDLITAPRCAPLLFGYRGGGPVDLEGLERLLLRLSQMAADLPQLAEADLNPVLARPDGTVAVDARIRLLPRRAHDPYLRRLR